jgi:hypothetical protein
MITLVFKKNANIFSENRRKWANMYGRKWAKIVMITLTSLTEKIQLNMKFCTKCEVRKKMIFPLVKHLKRSLPMYRDEHWSPGATRDHYGLS